MKKNKKLQAVNLRFEMLFYEIDYGAAQEEELSCLKERGGRNMLFQCR